VASETSVSVPRTELVSAQRLPVTITVEAPLPVDGATVQLLLDGEPVGDAVALKNGVARLQIGPLDAGTHELTAEFGGVARTAAGVDGVAASTSEPVTLTVRAVGPGGR
jgi:hypothetical protein